MSHSQSKSSSNSQTESKPVSLQDVDGIALAGNEGSSFALTDGGAISGSLDLAGLTVERAAELTLGLVSAQADAARQAFDFALQGQAAGYDFAKGSQDKGYDAAAASQEKGYGFAMSAGRSDVSTIQDATKKVLIMIGILAGAYVLSKWGKA